MNTKDRNRLKCLHSQYKKAVEKLYKINSEFNKITKNNICDNLQYESVTLTHFPSDGVKVLIGSNDKNIPFNDFIRLVKNVDVIKQSDIDNISDFGI